MATDWKINQLGIMSVLLIRGASCDCEKVKEEQAEEILGCLLVRRMVVEGCLVRGKGAVNGLKEQVIER